MNKYDYIKLCLGYPRADDKNRIIWRKWVGVSTGKFQTDLFGEKFVYAIPVDVFIYRNQFTAPETFNKNVLTLNLKRKYWEQIKDGQKRFEFRECKEFWKKRLTINKKEVMA